MKIVMIGAGNVGHHLARKFHESGENILQVFSRKELKAKTLAQKVQAKFTNKLPAVETSADLYVLAVNDDAVVEVAAGLSDLNLKNKLVVHTSGATPGTVFKPHFRRFGVFYPLQTFSLSREPNFEEIPICIDAALPKDLTLLKNLAGKTSPLVFQINDQQRAVLHLAAVFANNFSNHLFHIGEAILEKEQLPFEMLKPLIKETVRKLENNKAAAMQTGPAIRKDAATIERHLNYLKAFPAFRKVYEILTESIQKNKK